MSVIKAIILGSLQGAEGKLCSSHFRLSKALRFLYAFNKLEKWKENCIPHADILGKEITEARNVTQATTESLTNSTWALREAQDANFIGVLANQSDLSVRDIRDGYWRASGSALVKNILLGRSWAYTTAALKSKKQCGFRSVLSHCIFA